MDAVSVNGFKNSLLGAPEMLLKESQSSRSISTRVSCFDFGLESVGVDTETVTLPNNRRDAAKLPILFVRMLQKALEYLRSEDVTLKIISGEQSSDGLSYCSSEAGFADYQKTILTALRSAMRSWALAEDTAILAV